jgi:hypothetical protein
VVGTADRMRGAEEGTGTVDKDMADRLTLSTCTSLVVVDGGRGVESDGAGLEAGRG